jgi:hypothetical protein
MEGPLDVSGGGYRIAGSGEHGEDAVAFTPLLEDDTAVALDAANQSLVVAPEGRLHALGVLLPAAG